MSTIIKKYGLSALAMRDDGCCLQLLWHAFLDQIVQLLLSASMQFLIVVRNLGLSSGGYIDPLNPRRSRDFRQYVKHEKLSAEVRAQLDRSLKRFIRGGAKVSGTEDLSYR
jgi:hypothetical protein